MQLNTSA